VDGILIMAAIFFLRFRKRDDDEDEWREVIHPPTPFEPLQPPDDDDDDISEPEPSDPSDPSDE
jgi:hypothetical protein